MVFSSITFLSVFLVIVFVLYSLIPNIHIKNGLLIIFSLLFYSVGEPIYVFLMLASSFVNYAIGVLIGKFNNIKKLWLFIDIFFNVGTLIVFKYVNFLIETVNQCCHLNLSITKIMMPIGISFFTFQAMSYVIDVYRGVSEYQRNYFCVLLYISFFPQLIAGPIIKYSDMEHEIQKRNQTVDEVEYGIRRFIVGLSKKVLISNSIAMVVDSLYANLAHMTFAGAWLFAIGYSLQIYYDFSGYSDMAIGLGRMFGFHFKENFNYPYAAKSIKDFWRRWHISLSTWFKEYVYIPLGGNRKGKVRTLINKYIVFFLTGLWHGANWTFIVWGLIHGTFSVLEEGKLFKLHKMKFVQQIYALLVVICAFVIFRADTITQGMQVITSMFCIRTGDILGEVTLWACLTPFAIMAFVLAILFSVPWWKSIGEKLQHNEKSREALHVLSGLGLLLCLLFCMVRLASDAYNPFIYFRF